MLRVSPPITAESLAVRVVEVRGPAAPWFEFCCEDAFCVFFDLGLLVREGPPRFEVSESVLRKRALDILENFCDIA